MTSPSAIAQAALALVRAGDTGEAARLLRHKAPEHAAAIALLDAGFTDYAETMLERLRPSMRAEASP